MRSILTFVNLCLCLCMCVFLQLGRLSVEYLVSSNERVYSQVVLYHFLCHVWRVGQHSALEQSGGVSFSRLSRRTGSLDVTEECIPRRLQHRERQIQQRQTNPSQTWAKTIPAAW